MKLQSTCFVLGAVLALTAPAWAQSKAIPPSGISSSTQTTSTGTQTTMTGTGTQPTSRGAGTQTGTGAGMQTSTTSTGAFQNLSPGGQRIAQSLYNAQNPPAGTTRLTLDQIATMKGREGWGRVFKEMKTDGLVQAKNLGQVVSGHARMASAGNSTATTGRGGQASTRTSGRNSTAATNGTGRSMSFASAGGRGGGRYAGGYSTHYTTGQGMYAGGMHGGMQGASFAGGGFHGGGGGGHGHGR